MRKYLRIMRENKNVSQQFVADLIGVSQQYYNMIENGERQPDMSLSMMKKLSEAFDVSIEYIIEEEGKLSGTDKKAG